MFYVYNITTVGFITMLIKHYLYLEIDELFELINKILKKEEILSILRECFKRVKWILLMENIVEFDSLQMIIAIILIFGMVSFLLSKFFYS